MRALQVRARTLGVTTMPGPAPRDTYVPPGLRATSLLQTFPPAELGSWLAGSSPETEPPSKIQRPEQTVATVAEAPEAIPAQPNDVHSGTPGHRAITAQGHG